MWPGSGLRVCAGQHHGAAVRRGVHRVWFGRLEWSSADKPLTSKTPTVLGARHNACVSTNSLLILISVGGLLQAVGVVLTAWQVVAVLAGRTNKLLLGLSKGLLKVSVVLFPFAGILSAGSLTVDRVGDLSAATGDATVAPEMATVGVPAHPPTVLINGRPAKPDVAWVPVIAFGVICALMGVGIGSWAAAGSL